MTVTLRKVLTGDKSVHPQYKCSKRCAKKSQDLFGILLLIFLYILQGIPLGLAAAIPYFLQSDTHTASYKYQAIFSWVFWPFSLKLAWAPIVDALYIKRIGRRKTWLIPVQYAIGLDLFVIAGRVDAWLGRPEGMSWGPIGVTGDIHIWSLTCSFFGLTMLAATQDIVVDGWALTMLSKENVSWASTCNTVGQTLGYIIGFIVFLVLESPDVCNNYLRSVPVPGEGIISFSGFLYCCGVIFIVSTTLLALLKSENDWTRQKLGGPCRKRTQSAVIDGDPLSASTSDGSGAPPTTASCSDDSDAIVILRANGEIEMAAAAAPDVALVVGGNEDERLSLLQTYTVMFGVLRLRPVMKYIAFIFLVKFVFSASDSVFGLKLLENGVSRERMALIGSAVLPLQALLPILVTHWSNGPRPLAVYLNAAIPRAVIAGASLLIIHYVDFFRTLEAPPPDNPSASPTYSFAASFYILIFCKFAVYSFFSHTMFVCQMAYHAKISDPVIGGTYMTMLNTAANLAASLPSTLMLFMVDPLSAKSCDVPFMERVVAFVKNTTSTAAAFDDGLLQTLATQYLSVNATCKGPHGVEACVVVGGSCSTQVDGFYIEVGICMLVGTVAFCTVLRPMARILDSLPLSAYRYRNRGSSSRRGGRAATATDNIKSDDHDFVGPHIS